MFASLLFSILGAVILLATLTAILAGVSSELSPSVNDMLSTIETVLLIGASLVVGVTGFLVWSPGTEEKDDQGG